jgi:glycosyltransferase involved in cell wall biosynthesis
MRFLFIHPSTGVLGGIETLLARMSRWLTENHHQVTLLVEQPGKWTDLLPRGVKCVVLDKRFPKLYYYFHARRLWNSLGIEKPDVIKSFDMGSSWIACQLAGIMGNNCKVIAGIYNPSIFRWYWVPESLLPWSIKRLYLRNYLKCIPASARVFCGVDQIEELEEVHQQAGILWPIPIDTTQFLPASRKPKWGRIVSVGRLSPMKDYNFYMFDVITTLRKKGYDVTWSVYGTGEYESRMRERIEQHGLQQVVSMEGAVPYNRFWKVLEDAYVFVGMGTAILEAALFKVPNVNALAYDREGMTHGSVHHFPPGSIGPSIVSPPRLKVVDEIERILRLGSAEYQTEAELVYAHMQDHLLDNSMNHFLKLVREAGPIRSPKMLYLANYPLWLIRCVMKRLVRPRETIHPASVPPTTPVNV